MVWNKFQELGIKDLALFLLENSFKRGKIDTTLFIMHKKEDFLIVQIYVDDIIFSATNQNLCKSFSKIVQGEFEMRDKHDGRTQVLS